MAASVHISKYKTGTAPLSALADASAIASWLIKRVFIGIHDSFAAIAASTAPVEEICFLIFLTEIVMKAAV